VNDAAKPGQVVSNASQSIAGKQLHSYPSIGDDWLNAELIIIVVKNKNF
jgi:hypothetical protein